VCVCVCTCTCTCTCVYFNMKRKRERSISISIHLETEKNEFLNFFNIHTFHSIQRGIETEMDLCHLNIYIHTVVMNMNIYIYIMDWNWNWNKIQSLERKNEKMIFWNFSSSYFHLKEFKLHPSPGIPCIVHIQYRSGCRELQFDSHRLEVGRVKKDNTMGGTRVQYI